MSPEQQRLYNAQTTGQQALADTALGGLDRIRDSFSGNLDLSGAPSRVSSVNGPNYDLYGGSTNLPNEQLGPQADYLKSLDFSGLEKVPGASDFASQGQQVQDTLYKQQTAKLDPQYQQQEDQLRTRLANSGIAPGTEAYSTALADFNRQRENDYGSARDRSILASGQEQSRLNSDALASRQQMLAQILSGGQFQNTSADQANAADLARATFGNVTSQQELQNRLTALGINNSTKAQQYADALRGADFTNNQRGAAIDEAAFLRNEPLNAYNALATGSQVTNPSFRGTAATAGPAAAPVFAGAQAAGQDALSLYNAQMDAANSAQSGLLGTIGTVAGGAMVVF